MKLPNGEFRHLEKTIAYIDDILMQTPPANDENERYQVSCCKDSAISTLFKIVIYQNDGGRFVNQETVDRVLTKLLPIKDDIEEAQALHQELLQLVIEKNPVLMKNINQTQACILEIKKYSESHLNEEEDILGMKGKLQLQAVIGLL